MNIRAPAERKEMIEKTLIQGEKRAPEGLGNAANGLVRKKDSNAVELPRKCYAVIIVGAPTHEEFHRSRTQ